MPAPSATRTLAQRFRLAALAALVLLAGCAAAPWLGEGTAPEADPAITESPLPAPDAPAETGEPPADDPDLAPEPVPDVMPAALPPAPPVAAPPPGPEPAALTARRQECARQGGSLRPQGGGYLACIRETRDAGQRCTTGAQCEGDCLARSNTCAPVAPLLGCHEVLIAQGARVEQCID